MAETQKNNISQKPEEEGIELKDMNEDDNNEKNIPLKTPLRENLINNSGDNSKNINGKKSLINFSKKNIIIIGITLFAIGLIIFFLMSSKGIIIDKAVIGLNLGSMNSGYYVIKNNNISLNNSHMNFSDLILDEYGFKGLEYGYNAHLFSKNDLKSENRIYFSNIKKYLLKNDILETKNITADFPYGKEVPLKIIIKEYLNVLKTNILKDESIKNIDNKDIRWIITLPSILNKENQKFMKDIIKDLDMKNYEIISESDAASLGIFYDENIKEFLIKDKAYMIINIDLFNTEIIINKILDDKYNLRELIPSSTYTNDNNGSYFINGEIINILEHVFGPEDINDKKNNDYDNWQITLDDIEKKKLSINDNMSEDLDIITEFSKGYKKYILQNVWDIDYQNYKIKNEKGKVFIPLEYLKKLIHDMSNNIIEEAEYLIKSIDEKIDLIIVTGEFSQSKVFQNNLIRNFGKSYNLLFLDDFEKTIMKGAAIYGFKPNKIKKLKKKDK